MSSSPRLNKGINLWLAPSFNTGDGDLGTIYPLPITPVSESHLLGTILLKTDPFFSIVQIGPHRSTPHFPYDIPRCLQVSQVISKFLPKRRIFIGLLYKCVFWWRGEKVIMREKQWFRIPKCPNCAGLQFLEYEDFSHWDKRIKLT